MKTAFPLTCVILFNIFYKILQVASQWRCVIPTGLQTSQDARFYALSSRFDDFSNQGQPMVIQFTVKHEQSIDCGGGYIKLFPSNLNQEDMHGDSVYNIMFGECSVSLHLKG